MAVCKTSTLSSYSNSKPCLLVCKEHSKSLILLFSYRKNKISSQDDYIHLPTAKTVGALVLFFFFPDYIDLYIAWVLLKNNQLRWVEISETQIKKIKKCRQTLWPGSHSIFIWWQQICSYILINYRAATFNLRLNLLHWTSLVYST